MIIKFVVNKDEGTFKWYNSQLYYKSNYNIEKIPELTQKNKLVILDLLILKELQNYKSVDDLYMKFYRTYGSADYRLVYKRLRYMLMKKIISQIIF